MLDATFASETNLPPFTSSYLEQRVNKESRDGISPLSCIRQVAERLSSNVQNTSRHIKTLCALAAPNARHIFSTHQSQENSISREEIEAHVHAAAVYIGNPFAAKPWGPIAFPRWFGDCTTLSARSGSMEMLVQYLEESHRGAYKTNRCRLLSQVALHSQVDMVRFVYNYRIESTPWCFDPKCTSPFSEIKVLGRALKTSDPEIWDYIMELHQQHGLRVRVTATDHLSRCAQKGWGALARHLLELGTDPNVPQCNSRGKTPIVFAAQAGHIDIVQALLERGSKIHDGAIRAAAEKGHFGTVQLLLTHGADATGATVLAAKSGYGDIVKLLLERGASPDEEDKGMPAIGHAIFMEHEPMFRSLLEHGAKSPARATRMEIVKRAREAGVESMLAMLPQIGRNSS
jgi:hypothetical protein